MVGADELVRFGRQEGKEVSRDLAFLEFPHRGPPRSPDAGNGREDVEAQTDYLGLPIPMTETAIVIVEPGG
jgi:hypothetical protein